MKPLYYSANYGNVPKYQIVCQLWLTIVIILLNSGVDPEMFQMGIEQGDKKGGEL